MRPILLKFIVFLLLLPSPARLRGETGYEAWLRYRAIDDAATLRRYALLPKAVVVAGDTSILKSAQAELQRGLRGMLGGDLQTTQTLPEQNAIVLGVLDDVRKFVPQLPALPNLARDGFWLKSVRRGSHMDIVITGPNDRGALYGTFALLRRMALRESVADLDQKESPYAPVRFLNHWDNLNGTIERGYAGKSIFWENDHVVDDLTRVSDYARLMASIGINGCSINNVNADARVITPTFLTQVARVADAFRPWGVRLLLSLDFASPRKIGGIDTFDPLDDRAVEFWKTKVDEVYRAIPDLAGFILKADSEGRLGPSGTAGHTRMPQMPSPVL